MFTLQYPIVTPTITVDLTDPIFSDVHRIDGLAIVRDVRSGELRSTRDSTWAIIEQLIYQFTRLTSSKILEIENFLATSAGQMVMINTNHLGEIWNGIISNAVTDIVTVRDTCSFDFNLEFQGVKQ